MSPRQPYKPRWVRAIVGPLGTQIPAEWRVRTDSCGATNIWVVHRETNPYLSFVVRHWQVSPTGQIRTATEPRIRSDSMLEARAVIPYGLIRVPVGVPDLEITEIWF
jgi:hypothetical protein